MPLLFMDTGYEPSSPTSSLSAEECSSNTSALDREREGPPTGPRGTKRREKNRDAARKSRRKQTERADELHEELQSLERSGLALQKEIAALKKDLRLYETALERHKPHCRLRDSMSSSVNCKASSSPPWASNSATASLSTSLNPITGFRTFNFNERTNLSSAPTSAMEPTASASSSSSSSSSPLPVTYAVSFSTEPAPHSLFSKPPSIMPTNIMPVSPSLVSNPASSPAALLQSDSVQKISSASQSSCFAGDAFIMKLDPSFTAPPKIQPLISHHTSPMKQSCPTNVPQLYPCHFGGELTLQPPPPQYAAPQVLPVSTQASLVPSPAVCYSQQAFSSSESLLSLLTVPSPLNVAQATSSSFNKSLSQPTPSLPPLPDPPKDYSLSELLEINDWILTGVSNQ